MRRLPLLSLIVLAAACSRAPAPSHATSSALPPPPDSSIAQAVPAGAAPAQPAGAPARAAPPDSPKAALSAPRNDPRWRDIDPSELAGRGVSPMPHAAARDPALAKFQQEQERRDAQLMAQDARDAELQGGRGDDRYARDDADPRDIRDERIAASEGRDWRDSERYRRYAERRARERGENGDGYYDPRRDDPRYRDDRYASEDDYPPEEMASDEPPQPWDEDAGPPPDEDYDPRYDDPYTR